MAPISPAPRGSAGDGGNSELVVSACPRSKFRVAAPLEARGRIRIRTVNSELGGHETNNSLFKRGGRGGRKETIRRFASSATFAFEGLVSRMMILEIFCTFSLPDTVGRFLIAMTLP